jgi:hypothetical protein
MLSSKKSMGGNTMVNPYAKNLSTVFKTLGSAVKGNEKAITALALLEEHVKRKTPKSRETRDYGIKPTDLVTQSEQFKIGRCVPRSQNIRDMVNGIGAKGRSVKIVKKELGLCEDNLDYLRLSS